MQPVFLPEPESVVSVRADAADSMPDCLSDDQRRAFEMYVAGRGHGTTEVLARGLTG